MDRRFKHKKQNYKTFRKKNKGENIWDQGLSSEFVDWIPKA